MNMLIETTETGQPIPGDWYHDYLASWRQAFPGRHETPGHYLGSIWHTHTPEWDEWFFNSLGVNAPAPIVRLPTPHRVAPL